MSRTIKLRKKAVRSKQAKGQMKGKDDSKKSKCPHLQSKPCWVIPKAKGKKKTEIK